ncbi:MAG: AMP-binding protein [Rhodospirillales bacterium]|nr:AMP-binding protein [Rhodospirillales bacterium]
MPGFRAMRDVLLAHRADPEAAAAAFAWPDEAEFNWALEWFDAVLARGPSGGQLALKIAGAGAAEASFAGLSEASDRVANGLREAGVARGDRVLLMLGNVLPLWEIMLAAMKLGAVISPATPLLTEADLAERVARGRIRHLIVASAETAKCAALDAALTRIAVGAPVEGWRNYATLRMAERRFVPQGITRAADPMLLYFTSGTTARPKLVLHSHRSYPVGHLSTMYQIGLQPGDLHLNISSPGWAKHAYSCLFAPWNAGAAVFMLNQPRFDAAGLLDALVEHRVSTICAPPTVWRMIVQQDMRAWPVSLREAVAAGEPLNPEVIAQVQKAWGITVRDFYGQTETTAQIGNPPGLAVKTGAMGKALPGYRIRLLDAEGDEVEEGEICIALDPPPAGMMQGYQQDDGSTAGLEGVAQEGGVYRTGDVARRDAEGYFTYVGRADDVFKASDYRISPFELESALIEHPAIAEAAVVPAPDPVRLAVPKAYLLLAPGHAPDRDTALAVFRHIRAGLAPFKRVRRIEFADLPKTISGKIRRVELRNQEAARAKAGERAAGEFRDEDFPELSA